MRTIGHIRNKIVIAVLLGFVLLLAWNIVRQVVHYRERRVEAIKRQQRSAQKVSYSFAPFICNIVRLNRIVGRTIWLGGAQEVSNYLANEAKADPRTWQLGTVNADGDMFAASDFDLMRPIPELRGPVHKVIQGADLALSASFYSEAAQGWAANTLRLARKALQPPRT